MSEYVPGTRDEARNEAAEDRGDFGESPRDQDDIDQFERLERVDEQRWNLANKAHQPRERALEPGPRARHRVGLLHVVPDLFLTDQLHEAADQGVRRAWYWVPGYRILSEHGLQ